MSLKTAILENIIGRAALLISALPTKLPEPKSKTVQEIGLDKFFSIQRFCEHHDHARELVKLLTGYLPEPEDALVVPDFTILWCSNHKCPWIMLPGGRGFALSAKGYFRNDRGCERLALQGEAREFLNGLEKVNPEEFFAWCKENLEDTDWMLEL